MKNFIFKSEADFHKIVFNKLEVILHEQTHQRGDLAAILYLLKTMRNDSKLQKTVDEYYDVPSPKDED